MTRAADRAPAADVRFFKTPAELRRWFAKHHASEDFLWVGFYKKDTREPSVTWPEDAQQTARQTHRRLRRRQAALTGSRT